MVDATVNRKDFNTKFKLAMKIWGFKLAQEMAKRAPVDTGRLKNSIKLSKSTRNMVEISMVNYAPMVEWGTPPHVIKPKGKPDGANVLKFKQGGRTVFATKVKHPGTRPKPFIRPAIFEKGSDLMFESFKDAFS